MGVNVTQKGSTVQQSTVQADFSSRIQASIQKSEETGRPFMVAVLQINNLDVYRSNRPKIVVHNLMRELMLTVRKAVHPSQYVGFFNNGLGLVFDEVDTGKIDEICSKLESLGQHIIKVGKYNDLSSRWTDIIQQFLFPQKPLMISAKIGWSIFPRDGGAPKNLMERALHIALERSR